MTHIQLADEGRQLITLSLMLLTVYGIEYLRNGRRARGSLSEHVFITGLCTQTNADDTGSLLSAVVLFFHEQVQFVQRILQRTVLLLIVFQWFQQPYHCHATFMFQLFHFVVWFGRIASNWVTGGGDSLVIRL